ncbi:unnamed protein product [Ambrosiozyma monospora]|uniref:Unnamed protein product n=1 Tax=Ambrosiozyma monospora TaxID=43982 RepID=A0ACB5U2L2_AMBMO|nr:unnamed protein product [Ambrosiozyma monospora]
MTSSTALSLLLLGLAGVTAVVLQFILLKVISNVDTQDLENMFTNSAKLVTNNISEGIDLWVNDTNDYIMLQQDTINDDLVGWVNTSTTAVNTTVSDFVDEMNDKIKDIFGDTTLYDIVQGVVGCVVTRHLENVEKAMTWISDNAHVTFPTIDRDNLTRTITDDSDGGGELSDKIDDQVKKLQDKFKTVRNKIVKQYKKSLMIELWIALALIFTWLFLFILAFMILLINKKLLVEKLNNEKTPIIDDDIPLTPVMTSEKKHIYDTPEKQSFYWPWND